MNSRKRQIVVGLGYKICSNYVMLFHYLSLSCFYLRRHLEVALASMAFVLKRASLVSTNYRLRHPIYALMITFFLLFIKCGFQKFFIDFSQFSWNVFENVFIFGTFSCSRLGRNFCLWATLMQTCLISQQM